MSDIKDQAQPAMQFAYKDALAKELSGATNMDGVAFQDMRARVANALGDMLLIPRSCVTGVEKSPATTVIPDKDMSDNFRGLIDRVEAVGRAVLTEGDNDAYSMLSFRHFWNEQDERWYLEIAVTETATSALLKCMYQRRGAADAWQLIGTERLAGL